MAVLGVFLILSPFALCLLPCFLTCDQHFDDKYFLGPVLSFVGGLITLDHDLIKLALVFYSVGVIIFVIGIIIAKKKKKIADAEAVVRKGKQDKIAFYRECIREGISGCSTEKDIQKANLIAKKLGLPTSNVSALFSEGKSLVEAENQAARTAELNKKKEEEKKEYAAMNKYANYTGRNKRIAILEDIRQEALRNEQLMANGFSAVVSASQQKEKNWAIAGGIAEGIAGPGAGIATALDVQMQNAEIRAQNQRNLSAAKPLLLANMEAEHRYRNTAEGCLKEIERTKTKLLGKEDAATCLKKLSFKNTRIEVTETGTCIVSTEVEACETVIIYDDVMAVIDGTIAANIYDGNKLIGVAPIVLPKYGVDGSRKVNVKGMSLFCGQKDKKYSVRFTAVNLWTMER